MKIKVTPRELIWDFLFFLFKQKSYFIKVVIASPTTYLLAIQMLSTLQYFN